MDSKLNNYLDVIELADTSSSDVTGTSFTAYGLQPSVWLKEIIQAAKKKQYFMQIAYKSKVPKGALNLVIPMVTSYSGTFTDTTSENTEVATTTLSGLDSKTITPTRHSYAVAISYYAIETNQVDLLKYAKERLTYFAGDVVDKAIASALENASTASASSAGAQVLYGGDAYSTATLEQGDVLTPELIAEAKLRLESNLCRYWDGGTEGICSEEKNPWVNEPNAPFVLFIGPEQEAALLKDPQFTNAAQYGSDEVIKNGFVAEYLGVKIVKTHNCPAYNNWGTSGNLSGRVCFMVKSKKAVAYVERGKPKIFVYDYPPKLQVKLIMVMDYAVDTLFEDAIVKIYVSDR